MAATEAVGPYELLARRVPGGLRVCKGLQAGERLAVSMHTFTPSQEQPTAAWLKKQMTTLKKLNHPHLFAMVDAVQQRNALAIVLSPLPTLYLLKRAFQASAHKPSLSESRSFFRQITFAIAHAHRNGVAHGALTHYHFVLSSPDHALVYGVGLTELPAPDTAVATPIFDALEPWETFYNFTPPEGFVPVVSTRDNADNDAVFQRRVRADLWVLGALLFALIKGHNYSPANEDLSCKLDDYEAPDDVRHLIEKLLQPAPETRMPLDQVLAHPWFLAEDADTIRREQHDLLDANEILEVPQYLLDAHGQSLTSSPVDKPLFSSPNARATPVVKAQDFSVVFRGPDQDILSFLVTKTDAHVFAVVGATATYECMCITESGLLHFRLAFAPIEGAETALLTAGMDSLNSVRLQSRATFTPLRGKESELAGVVDAVRRGTGSSSTEILLTPTSTTPGGRQPSS